MYYAYSKWEIDATAVGAEFAENKRRTLATVRGVVIGRWDKHSKTGELKRGQVGPVRRTRPRPGHEARIVLKSGVGIVRSTRS